MPEKGIRNFLLLCEASCRLIAASSHESLEIADFGSERQYLEMNSKTLNLCGGEVRGCTIGFVNGLQLRILTITKYSHEEASTH